MKERPILFSGEMVRALLAGTKMQTRRVVRIKNPRAAEALRDAGAPEELSRGYFRWFHRGEGWNLWADKHYGMPGDRLWVRETWAPVDFMTGSELEEPIDIGYRADLTARICTRAHGGSSIEQRPMNTYAWNWDIVKWKPSIYMPRWASRITLELTAVRVEHLQDIGEDDAFAEGMTAGPNTTPREQYELLWDELNGHRDGCAWIENPWVWALTFKVFQR